MAKKNRREDSHRRLNEKQERSNVDVNIEENSPSNIEVDQTQNWQVEETKEHDIVTDDVLDPVSQETAEIHAEESEPEVVELDEEKSPQNLVSQAAFSNSIEEEPQIMTNHSEVPQSNSPKNSKLTATVAYLAVIAALGSAGFGFINNQQSQANIAALNEKIGQTEAQLKAIETKAAQLDLSQIDKVKAELNAELDKVSKNVLEQLKGTQSADGELRQNLDNSLKKIELLNTKLAEQASLLTVVQSSAKSTEGKINSVEVSVKESLLQQQAAYQDINKVAQTIANTTDMQGLNLAEVHYLIKMADHKLQFEHDKDTAIVALEKANQRLTEVNESGFVETQNRIKETLLALKAVKIPPRDEMLQKLNDIALIMNNAPILANAEVSKLRSDFNNRVADAAPKNSAMQKIWDSVKHLFVIKRDRVKIPALMATEDAFYLNQNIQLQLNAAKNTVIENLPQAYLATIDQALVWIKTYYNQEDSQVALAVAHLNQLKEMPLRADLPKVTAILSAFEASMQLRKGATK